MDERSSTEEMGVMGELVVAGAAAAPAQSAGEFSPWAEEVLRSLERASVAERKVIAERVRDEVRTAVDCIGTGVRSVFEAVAIVTRRQLHVDLGYGTPEEWFQAEVVPHLVEVSKGSLSKLKSAVRIYTLLSEKYPGVEVKAHYTTLSLLDAEYRRHEAGDGIPGEDLERLERQLIEGGLSRQQLEVELRELRKKGQRLTRREARGFPGETSLERSAESDEVSSEISPPPATGRIAEERRVVVDPMAELDRYRAEIESRRPTNVERVPKVVHRAAALVGELRELLSEIAVLPVDAWTQVPEETLKELPGRLRELTEEAEASSMAMNEILSFLGIARMDAEGGTPGVERGFRAETSRSEAVGDEFADPFADESAA